MRERFSVFAADVTRFGPLAVVSLATALCLPSLDEFFTGRLAISSMLGRYFVAFLLAYFGVRVITSVLLRYAIRNATQAGFAGGPLPGGNKSSDRASERRN